MFVLSHNLDIMHATGYYYIDDGSLVRKQLNYLNVKSNFTDILVPYEC